jgi:anaerobic magnesium-protoporphyrin IX monomethyl ester cyclase
VKTQLGTKTHWRESNDLEMMFRGTYSSEFYRTVRELLHDQVTNSQSNRPDREDDGGRSVLSLHRRWESLISSERRYRSGDDAAPSGDAALAV